MKTKSRKLISRAAHLLALGLIILLLASFTAGTALACHKGKPHGKDAPDACDPPVAPVNLAVWGISEAESGIFEHDPRRCSLSEVAPDFTSGRYVCSLNTVHIHYAYDQMPCVVAHQRGDDWRCPAYGEYMHIEPDLEYSFRWDGNCTSTDGCEVTIVNRFSNSGTIGGLVGHVTMEAIAPGVTSGTMNPFLSGQDLEIDRILVTKFATRGKNKVLAICELSPISSMLVTFHTNPVADPQ